MRVGVCDGSRRLDGGRGGPSAIRGRGDAFDALVLGVGVRDADKLTIRYADRRLNRVAWVTYPESVGVGDVGKLTICDADLLANGVVWVA